MNTTTTPLKLTARARREIVEHALNLNRDYLANFAWYSRNFTERPPHGVPDRNMVKALRMHSWQNTPEEWARLHVCEAFLKARKV